MPRREPAAPAEAAAAVTAGGGSVAIEAYSVMHDRESQPETAFVACLLADGRRAWARSTDRTLAVAMCSGEWIGRAVTIDAGGNFSIA